MSVIKVRKTNFILRQLHQIATLKLLTVYYTRVESIINYGIFVIELFIMLYLQLYITQKTENNVERI